MMGISLLVPVAVATLRRRWLGFAGSFVALTLGVALISATGLLVSTSAGLQNSDPSAPSLKKLLTFMAGMSGFVSVFVVASTFAFAVAGRRRETALLRAVGATPVRSGCSSWARRWSSRWRPRSAGRCWASPWRRCSPAG